MKPAIRLSSRPAPGPTRPESPAGNARRGGTRSATRPIARKRDPLTQALFGGAIVACLVGFSLLGAEIRDGRALLTPLLIWFGTVVVVINQNLPSLMPRAHRVRNRNRINLVAGVPVGILVFGVWTFFGPLYELVAGVVWAPVDAAGGAYVENMTFALGTAGAYLLGLVLGGLVLALQLSVWILPCYAVARYIARPVEAQIEKAYENGVRRATTRVVGRKRRLTKFRVGGELANTKVQIRTYGALLSLASSLATMTILVWALPRLH